ncbi:DNA helicase [Maritalea sp.]|uniref:DNA helicase n=1 Tax=Maritalea sp. TaxID=2003361 RepID=UPI003EF6633A
MKLSAPIYQLKRQAKLLARQNKMPLHQALDQIARTQGFASWSLLSAKAQSVDQVEKFAKMLCPADMVLLGGRPGHGKTMVALEVAFLKLKSGFDAYFFTLEYHDKELSNRLAGMANGDIHTQLIVDTSDKICADYVIEKMENAPQGAVGVIDYLQLLDQRRTTPELGIQLKQLNDFARSSDVTLVLISQIDRAFERSGKDFPDLGDVRQPNPIDLQLFNKTCFVHDQQLRWNKAA